jgi:hypothetical protein
MKYRLNYLFLAIPFFQIFFIGNTTALAHHPDSSNARQNLSSSDVSVFEKEPWQNTVSECMKKQVFLKDSPHSATETDSGVHLSPAISIHVGIDRIKKRLGLERTTPKKAKKKKSLRRLLMSFEPSPVQLETLSLLSQKIEATQLDLYPLLSESPPILMEQFNRSLDELVIRGFLTKKKISPQNIFTFFYIPIEMSSKNRKNPVYLYALTVEPEELKNYLQTKNLFSPFADPPSSDSNDSQ